MIISKTEYKLLLLGFSSIIYICILLSVLDVCNDTVDHFSDIRIWVTYLPVSDIIIIITFHFNTPPAFSSCQADIRNPLRSLDSVKTLLQSICFIVSDYRSSTKRRYTYCILIISCKNIIGMIISVLICKYLQRTLI